MEDSLAQQAGGEALQDELRELWYSQSESPNDVTKLNPIEVGLYYRTESHAKHSKIWVLDVLSRGSYAKRRHPPIRTRSGNTRYWGD